MLILTRRNGETLKIGDDVSVTVISVKGNQIKLGIDAPGDVGIYREEIYRRIQLEKQTGETFVPPKFPTSTNKSPYNRQRRKTLRGALPYTDRSIFKDSLPD